MGKSVLKKDVGNYRIKIYPDENPSDPREDDHLGKMICRLRRNCRLGDVHNFDQWDQSSASALFHAIHKAEKYKVAVMLPIFIYEHGGMTINTTGFDCQWDSGQLGWIYATKADVRENWGIKNVTKKWKEKTREILIAEVKEYDQYLQNDVYGYKIFNLGLDGKKGDEVDSSWGYYGDKECMDEAVSLARGFTVADELGI